MALPRASRFKGAGYLTSTISVVLLAVVALESATKNPVLLGCLIVGAATSVGGMIMRWRSHRIQEAEKAQMEDELDGAREGARR